MDYMQDKIRVITEQLDALRVAGKEPLDGFVCCPAPYKTSNRPPEGPWTPWDRGESYQGKDAHYWFRRRFTAPEGFVTLTSFPSRTMEPPVFL